MLLLVLTVDVSVRVVVPGTGPVTVAVVDVVPVTKMGWMIVVSVVAAGTPEKVVEPLVLEYVSVLLVVVSVVVLKLVDDIVVVVVGSGAA